MERDVVVCAACSRVLTRPVRRTIPVPQWEYADEERNRFRPTMPRGSWAVDPEPRMRTADGEPADTPGCVLLHPQDGLGLETHPDPRRNSGCCGHDGCDGPNLRCPRCHADVATLRDDCWTVVELRFEPAAVRVTPAR